MGIFGRKSDETDTTSAPAAVNPDLRLHRHARVESSTAHLALRVVREEVAPQTAHRVVDPGVLGGVVSPEMLMRVDFHFWLA